MSGSGNYPRCRVTGCVNRSLAEGRLCEQHDIEPGRGRKAPSPRQMAEAADILRRFAGSRELTGQEDNHVIFSADLLGIAALAQQRRPT